VLVRDVHDGATRALVRRIPPAEFGDPQHRLLQTKHFIFGPRRLRPRLWLLPPPFCSRELRTIDSRDPPQGWRGIYPKVWDPSTYEAYEQFWRGLAAKHPNAFGPLPAGDMIHHVGGIPFSIGDPVETDCVKFADDDYNSQPQVRAWFERGRKDGAPIYWPDFEEQDRAFRSFEDRQRTPAIRPERVPATHRRIGRSNGIAKTSMARSVKDSYIFFQSPARSNANAAR
jgi:hypothetical protein